MVGGGAFALLFEMAVSAQLVDVTGEATPPTPKRPKRCTASTCDDEAAPLELDFQFCLPQLTHGSPHGSRASRTEIQALRATRSVAREPTRPATTHDTGESGVGQRTSTAAFGTLETQSVDGTESEDEDE